VIWTFETEIGKLSKDLKIEFYERLLSKIDVQSEEFDYDEDQINFKEFSDTCRNRLFGLKSGRENTSEKQLDEMLRSVGKYNRKVSSFIVRAINDSEYETIMKLKLDFDRDGVYSIYRNTVTGSLYLIVRSEHKGLDNFTICLNDIERAKYRENGHIDETVDCIRRSPGDYSMRRYSLDKKYIKGKI
jgi:hypothetical protein